MESQKIINLLDHKDEDDPRFETKKWYIANDNNNIEIIAEVMMCSLLLNLIQRL